MTCRGHPAPVQLDGGARTAPRGAVSTAPDPKARQDSKSKRVLTPGRGAWLPLIRSLLGSGRVWVGRISGGDAGQISLGEQVHIAGQQHYPGSRVAALQLKDARDDPVISHRGMQPGQRRLQVRLSAFGSYGHLSLHLDATVQLAAPALLLDPLAELAGLLAHLGADPADLEGVKLG